MADTQKCIIRIRNQPPRTDAFVGPFDTRQQAVDFMKKHDLINKAFWSNLDDPADYGLPPVAERAEILEKAAKIMEARGRPGAATDARKMAAAERGTEPEPGKLADFTELTYFYNFSADAFPTRINLRNDKTGRTRTYKFEE